MCGSFPIVFWKTFLIKLSFDNFCLYLDQEAVVHVLCREPGRLCVEVLLAHLLLIHYCSSTEIPDPDSWKLKISGSSCLYFFKQFTEYFTILLLKVKCTLRKNSKLNLTVWTSL